MKQWGNGKDFCETGKTFYEKNVFVNILYLLMNDFNNSYGIVL